MNGKKVIKWSFICLLVIVSGGAIGAMTYITVSVKRFDQVYAHNVSVEGVSIGGLTRAEAKAQIEPKAKAYLETKSVTLIRGEVKVTRELKTLPVAYELDAVLDKAYVVGHDRKLLDRYALATNKHTLAPVDFEIAYTFNEEEITKWVNEISGQFEKKAVDATIERKNKQFVITAEQDGEIVDVDQTAANVISILKKGHFDEVVEVVTQPVKAIYTAESFKDVQTPIASFKTNYNNADPLRNENLKVASSKINKTLAPGEIFSLGTQLEPITYEEGYRSSKVIVNGQLEDGIGGGVCQIASTLYNAVLLSNLDITMRQNHSLPVAYVPLGRDATYATGIIDFKFQNTTEYPAFIESYCENNEVVVNIFGHKELKPVYDEIKFYSETIEVIAAPATQYQNDPSLQQGKKVQKVAPLEGKKVKLYKMCYKDGQMVHKEWINQSYYKPRAAIVRVGTKALPKPQPQPPTQTQQPQPQPAQESAEKQLGDQ
ncbi:MAG: VanW family protein [Cellulosilyticaceae bacterium]